MNVSGFIPLTDTFQSFSQKDRQKF